MSSPSGLLPCRSEPTHNPDQAVISLDSEEPVFDVLAAQTARAILTELLNDPTSVSEVADAVGTSTQNAAYHVGNLKEAGLVEVVDTWYSAKGNEMDVYAPTYDMFVLSMDTGSDGSLPAEAEHSTR